jgi:hypothetical protein
VLLHLGKLEIWYGNDTRARALLEELVALDRLPGEAPWAPSRVMSILSVVARLQGDYQQARNLLMESVRLDRLRTVRSNTAWWEWFWDAMFGDLARVEGDFAEATIRYGAAAAGIRAAQWRPGFAYLGNLFGVMAIAQGRHARGVRLLGATDGDDLQTAAKFFPEMPREREEALVAARAALGEEAFAAAWAEGQALTLEEAVDVALARDETGPD